MRGISTVVCLTRFRGAVFGFIVIRRTGLEKFIRAMVGKAGLETGEEGEAEEDEVDGGSVHFVFILWACLSSTSHPAMYRRGERGGYGIGGGGM